jgi:hypothetical protein
LIFVSERLKHALKPYTNCWKRAALIIGAALAGIPTVTRLEDLPSDVVESLGDALNRCGVDDYLLVGNVIPLLIWYLVLNNARVSTEAFIDKYDEVVAKARRVLGIARGRGSIYDAEGFYGLGLASIIAKAVESGKPVGPSDADTALHIASFTIQRVVSPILIGPILSALGPLRGEAPQRYIELLAAALNMENLDRDTVEYILNELNEVLDNYGDVVKGCAWFLVNAIIAYANLLGKHRRYFDDEKVEDMVRKIADLLNELGRFKSSLGVIAWAVALDPALMHGGVRVLMERALHIDVVDKAASEILEKLNNMRERVQELMGDEEFMGYVESGYVKADEEAVKKAILGVSSLLKHALALYRLNNNEFEEAAKLFNETAKEYWEIGVYENYLINSGWVLRVGAIKDPLAGDKLINGFRQLYEETFKEPFEYTAEHLSFASHVLGNYLVSLALTGNYETISKLLEKHWWILNADRKVSVLTKLMLNALLSHRVELSSELKDKLNVSPEELIDAFEEFEEMYSEFLPALNSAIEWLRWELVDGFRESLIERFGWLKGLGVNADKLLNMFDEFMKLVSELDGKSLAQLIASTNSGARLALMLHALINGDERLAKAHALMGAVEATEKLPGRLYLEAYEECCDLGSEEFRRAIAKLFFYHV